MDVPSLSQQRDLYRQLFALMEDAGSWVSLTNLDCPAATLGYMIESGQLQTKAGRVRLQPILHHDLSRRSGVDAPARAVA